MNTFENGSFQDTIAKIGYGIADAAGGTDNLGGYQALKLKAEQWKAEQQQKIYEQQLALEEKGYQPIAKFKGGAPEDYTAITIPGGGGSYFKPLAEDKLKTILAEGKAKAINGLTPEQQAEYFLNGGKLPKDAKPSALALQKFAAAEAYKLSGGSMMVGLTPANQAKYQQKTDEIYKSLLKKYKVSDGYGGSEAATDPEANLDYTNSNF